MLKKHYEIERQGQMDFFDNYGIDYQGDNSILVDNTDGIYQGNILEFKLNISDLNKVLFQVVKYLSHMRVRGESVPARILLIDLNATKVYVYKSINYLNDIEKIYTGGASINDVGFAGNNTPDETLDYSDMVDSDTLKNYLLKTPEKDWYTPVHIDENDIVGWAERYYREVPKATKGDFLGDDSGQVKITGEIRDPKHFKGLIYPYTEKTNEKFKYLMDMLNDNVKAGDRIEIDNHGNVYKVDVFGDRIDNDENSQPNYAKKVCKDSKKLIHDTNAWLSHDTYTFFICILFGLIIIVGIFS